MRKVDTLQIPAQEAQQVDDVAWTVSLLGWLASAPAVQQLEQSPFDSAGAADGGQMLQDRLADKSLLGAADVILVLGADQRVLQQLIRPSVRDLVADFLHQAAR